VIGDQGVKVTAKAARNKPGKPNVLTPALLGPAEKLTAKYYPGLPVIPSMSTGATDSTFMQAVGIPSFGAPGLLGEADGGGTHGLNERIRVESIYKGRDFLHDLIKVYAQSR
jgi:acetylornithine deacetylase/succinyl-diaminopimelate desuccinylase-like protein